MAVTDAARARLHEHCLSGANICLQLQCFICSHSHKRHRSNLGMVQRFRLQRLQTYFRQEKQRTTGRSTEVRYNKLSVRSELNKQARVHFITHLESTDILSNSRTMPLTSKPNTGNGRSRYPRRIFVSTGFSAA